jgi:hypothetical protein
MQVNVQEFLKEAGVTEAFYPGKRLVQECRQSGEFKSHCVVLDWRSPDKIRIEVKAGLSGRDLEPARLRNYPVCFQTPTYVDIEVINDNTGRVREEEEEGKSSSSSSGGGGKQPAKRKPLENFKLMAAEAFGQAREGRAPELGKIVEMVVLGTKIAADAYANVMGRLAQQINNAKVSATDLLAQAGKFVTKYTPPAFMKATGTEDRVYKYDREKNADIGFKPGLG